MKEILQNKEWDYYWGQEKKRKLYDIIASFYRNKLIKGSLNSYIKKYFKKDSIILHAGCGSGQVDLDIQSYVNVIPMDISWNALLLYNKFNNKKELLLKGNLFELPFKKNSLDGIYNLGVMEHFEEKEVIKILKSFKALLKCDGKVILFIPPEFGLSVIFFKILKFFSNYILRKEVKFHPDEICRIQSKAHAEFVIKESGLKIIELYFGYRDFFTYAVIVAKKNS